MTDTDTLLTYADTLGWKRMDEAVRDRPMLIREEDSMFVAEWNFINAVWEPPNCYASDSDCGVYCATIPTHFMPLPDGNAGNVVKVLVEALQNILALAECHQAGVFADPAAEALQRAAEIVSGRGEV